MNSALEQFYVRNKLTEKIISKNILSHISLDSSPPSCLVEELQIDHEVKQLSKVFETYRKPGDQDDGKPRYLPFYRYIKTQFPEFSWKVSSNKGKPMVVLNKPFIDHREPSLLKLLICTMK